jgi:hypothetical protein
MGLGNAELPMLHFWRLYPGYEHYWIVEYDVRFSGCWREFFRYWDENDADLLSTTLTPYEQCREWPHWDSLRTSECDDHSTCVRDFFPVYRVAQPALTTLDGSCRACAAGHMEALLPSTLNAAGLAREDTGGDGPYVRPKNVNRFHRNSPGDNSDLPGIFVYRPIRDCEGEEPGKLWHPVKLSEKRLQLLAERVVNRRARPS